jgi:hypothetical protein
MRKKVRSTSLLMLLACGAVHAQNAPWYALTKVTVPAGAIGIAQVLALDAKGEAVGNLYQGSGGEMFPAAWSKSAVRAFTSPFGNGQPAAILAANRVGGGAGWGKDASGKDVNVYWDSSGDATILPNGGLQIIPCCISLVVSDNGVIVGSAVNDRYYEAVIWSPPSVAPRVLHQLEFEPVFLRSTYSFGRQHHPRFRFGSSWPGLLVRQRSAAGHRRPDEDRYGQLGAIDLGGRGAQHYSELRRVRTGRGR